MSTILSVILISILAVGIFVLGLSLTLIIKGHNIKSEIGENENMKKLGIKCAAQQMREEERAFMGKVYPAMFLSNARQGVLPVLIKHLISDG